MWFHSKGCIFQCIIVFSSPGRCCANIGREVRLMLLNTYQEIYDSVTHTSLNFSNTCQICVYIRHIKSQCELITLWGGICSKKRLAGRSFFQNSGAQGPGCVSPAGFRGQCPRAIFSCCFEA